MIKIQSLIRSISVRLFRVLNAKKFRNFGKNVYIFPGINVVGEQNIDIDDHVIILDDSVLAVHVRATKGAEQTLSIGEGSNIGRRNHIYALNRVVIGRKVLTASNVYISDCSHNFSDPFTPIIDQSIKALSPVTIGEGTWIGQGACVIGCSVGRNCVIGANSVVINDIPDYSVVVGMPARVIRRFDPRQNKWIKNNTEVAKVNL